MDNLDIMEAITEIKTDVKYIKLGMEKLEGHLNDKASVEALGAINKRIDDVNLKLDPLTTEYEIRQNDKKRIGFLISNWNLVSKVIGGTILICSGFGIHSLLHEFIAWKFFN